MVPLIEKKNPWISYVGWAASVLLAIGLFWMYNQNQELKSELEVVGETNLRLEDQIADSDTSLEKTQALLNALRDKEIEVITLGGQAVSPDSYAKAYWNKTKKKYL